MSKTTPLAEWQAEMEQRGKLDCKFLCPNCGNIASPRDFVAVGADASRAAQECIGRTELGMTFGGERPCDYASYGLIPGPRRVEMPDGETIFVFDFAEEAP